MSEPCTLLMSDEPPRVTSRRGWFRSVTYSSITITTPVAASTKPEYVSEFGMAPFVSYENPTLSQPRHCATMVMVMVPATLSVVHHTWMPPSIRFGAVLPVGIVGTTGGGKNVVAAGTFVSGACVVVVDFAVVVVVVDILIGVVVDEDVVEVAVAVVVGFVVVEANVKVVVGVVVVETVTEDTEVVGLVDTDINEDNGGVLVVGLVVNGSANVVIKVVGAAADAVVVGFPLPLLLLPLVVLIVVVVVVVGGGVGSVVAVVVSNEEVVGAFVVTAVVGCVLLESCVLWFDTGVTADEVVAAAVAVAVVVAALAVKDAPTVVVAVTAIVDAATPSEVEIVKIS